MKDLQRTSESVCMGLCRIVGTSQQVAMRRDVIDISDAIELQKAGTIVGCKMKNGSYKEGFRLRESDLDTCSGCLTTELSGTYLRLDFTI